MLAQRLKQMLQPLWSLVIAGAIMQTMAGPQRASAATVVNFAPGVEASPTGLTPGQIAGLQTANFNTLVLFSITITTNGTFYYGGGGGPNILLCTNGAYVGPSNWGSLLNQCEASPSSISRIEMCIGGYLDQSFLNIKNLIAANGTGTNTVLYQNLSALKNALSLNAMDYDDEYEYDSSSAISFGQMCAAVGMKVTFCPYTNPGYWQAVKSGLGSTVDYVYLQCYAGGQGQDAATWSGYFSGSVPVLPGDWDADPGGDIGFLNLMHMGAREGCVGGWFWPNEANGTISTSTLDHYINLIRAGFGPNIYWQGGTADYNAGANWVGGIVPGAGTNAINDSGSNNIVQINAADPAWTLNDLWAGDGSAATGAYVQNGSTVNVGTAGGWVRLGDSSGAVGYYTLNAGTLNATNNLDVGEAGTGILNINGGIINIGGAGLFDVSDTGTKGVVTQTNGTVNCSAQMWVGQNTGTGTYTLSGGALNVHNYLVIGRSGGTGTLVMTNGTLTQDTSGNLLVGTGYGTAGGTSVATLNQSGGTITSAGQILIPEEAPATSTCNFSGGMINANNWFVVGRGGGVGTFTMTGGTINKNNSGAFIVSSYDGGTSVGTFNQSAGVINCAAQYWIGNGNGGTANGTNNISGTASVVTSDWVAIGRGGVGVLNISGGSFTKTGNSGNLDLGAGGNQNGGVGTLTQSGGFITNTASGTWLGEVGNATWNLNGGTDILGQVTMCLNNLGLNATLNLNGGLFQTSGITNNTPAGDTSILSFNGGVLQANASNPNFVSSLSQALVKPGGAVIDSQIYSITIPQALLDSGGGGLTKLGTGVLTLTGANAYTGPTVVNSGTLALTGSGQIGQSSLISVMAGAVLNVSGRSDQTLTLNSGQTLKGSGSVNGKLSALAGSTINPGDAIGTLTVQNNITLAGQLLMELSRTNVQNCDELVSSVGSIGGGGLLTVTNLGPALQLGDTFQLFNQPVNGFTTINLPNVAPYNWANNLAANGTIQVTVASTSPTSIATGVTGNSLVLSWPTDHTGWQLQCQTNSLTGTNWVDVLGSTTTNQVTIPLDAANGSVFFRLIYNP